MEVTRPLGQPMMGSTGGTEPTLGMELRFLMWLGFFLMMFGCCHGCRDRTLMVQKNYSLLHSGSVYWHQSRYYIEFKFDKVLLQKELQLLAFVIMEKKLKLKCLILSLIKCSDELGSNGTYR